MKKTIPLLSMSKSMLHSILHHRQMQKHSGTFINKLINKKKENPPVYAYVLAN